MAGDKTDRLTRAEGMRLLRQWQTDLWLWWFWTKGRWRSCPECSGWGGIPVEGMTGHEQICPRCHGSGRRWGKR